MDTQLNDSAKGGGNVNRKQNNDEITKRDKETFGGDGYVHWLDCGGGLMREYICEKLLKCTLYMYSLLYVIYTSMNLFKKKAEDKTISCTYFQTFLWVCYIHLNKIFTLKVI